MVETKKLTCGKLAKKLHACCFVAVCELKCSPTLPRAWSKLSAIQQNLYLRTAEILIGDLEISEPTE